jgi:multiple sugar transport system ATP-binding protein
MTGIRLSGVTKSFGDTSVLKGIHLDIAPGEFLTLVGPSGCGKSTLLRIIAGLEEQSGGDVDIGGVKVNNLRASKRDLAMVFQSYALYPHLTIAENMQTPLRLRDLTFWERFPLIGRFWPGYRAKMMALNATVQDTADTLEIGHLLGRKPGQLSGGQRQRAALGRAMVRKPVAFLMDEPLSNLDAALRVHMRSELADLHRSLRTTFIYVTHDQAEALTMSDRMAVMIDGNILQLGAPDDIYRSPDDRRVAEFVGSPKINIIPGEADGAGRISAYGTPLQQRVAGRARRLDIGIRPEHLMLPPDGAHNQGWPFTVTHKENLGSDFFLHGHLNGSEHRIVARMTPDEVQSISVGTEITLCAAPDTPIAFGEDGRRVRFIRDAR